MSFAWAPRWHASRPGDEAWARSISLSILIVALSALVCRIATSASSLPAGFVEDVVATGLTQPLSLRFAPDGRIFVTERVGKLRIIKDGQLLAAPFLQLPVTNAGSHGLVGVAFDPGFSANRYLYVLYHHQSGGGRISRFRASLSNPDVVETGSETVIYTDFSTGSLDHVREIVFGPDGMLYFGGYSNPVRRIDPSHYPDVIPPGNPTAGSAIWATGFRAPTSLVFNPATGGLLANDGGWHEAERIRTVVGGSSTPATLYSYSPGGGGALTGGAFLGGNQFPSQYSGMYFFVDHVQSFLKYLDGNNQAVAFATALRFPVDLKCGPDGMLYYTDLGVLADLGTAFNSPQPTGSLRRIRFAGQAGPPVITTQPSPQSATVGQTATFSVIASGAGPLAYQWRRNGIDIAGAQASTFVTPPLQASDNGAQLSVLVSNASGSVLSSAALLTVVEAGAPVITVQPASAIVSVPETATFSVAAIGAAPLTYQWLKQGVAIPNATSAVYVTPPTTASDTGSVFRVVVSNPQGSVASMNATLTVSSIPIGGPGLRGEYFDTIAFTGSSQARVDPTIDFDWGTGAPTHHGIGANNFSVRWTGWLRVPFSGQATFYTLTDEGARLWVNGVLLIDDWQDHPATERSATIALQAGSVIPIEMDYYENAGAAVAHLLWKSAFLPKAVIPQTNLLSTEPTDAGDNDGDGVRNDQDPDDDNDGIPDFRDPDRDGDAVSNQDELALGSLPGDKDSTPSSTTHSSRGHAACGALGIEFLALLLLWKKCRR